MKVKELIEHLELLNESGEMDVVLLDTDDDNEETSTKSISSVECLLAFSAEDINSTEGASGTQTITICF